MNCRELGHEGSSVSLREAFSLGLGPNGGLLLPESWPRFSEKEVEELLALESQDERLGQLGERFFADEFGVDGARRLVTEALDFPFPVLPIDGALACVELFHGPTLAFKDAGARFLVRALAASRDDGGGPATILTATSGDTGAAVAHAFSGRTEFRVVVLYPEGRVSRLQELQLTTLGGNVIACAVEGAFDDCQRLVRDAFADPELRARAGLTTANSMNLGRLLPQVLYYFEAVAGLRRLRPEPSTAPLVVCVPSGNFGNLTAALLAAEAGLPVHRFLAATNVNDTIPRYLRTGAYEPHETVATISNAMDVSAPNNWPRVEALLTVRGGKPTDRLSSAAITDERTVETIREVAGTTGRILDPHAAVGCAALRDDLRPGEAGLFLATAHPAKFPEPVTRALGRSPDPPPALAGLEGRPEFKRTLDPGREELAKILLGT